MLTPESPRGIARYIPILGWLPSYQRNWMQADAVAGLTAAAVVIPQAMAYASIAGLPVEAGLYVALVPMLVYAMLGTSRPLSVSATSTIAMLTASELARLTDATDPYALLAPAATLAVLVGGFLVLAAFLRLGFVANFISLPVLTGFKAGIGTVIFVGQLGKFLGISVEKGPFFQTIASVIRGLDSIHWLTLGVSLVTLAILIGLPRLKVRISAPLVAVAAGVALSALFTLDTRGVELVGEIPSGLPSLSLPDLSLMSQLWPGALGIALMSFTESIAAARSFQKHGEPDTDPNQELFALGMANIGGGLSQAFPAGGGTSQTAVNDQAGAKSQVAEIVTAGAVVVTLLFLSGFIGRMPQATLGALVLVAAAGLIKVDEFRKIGRIRIHELAWAIAALAGVVLLGTLEGILVAVVLSMLDLVYQANHPRAYEVRRKLGTDVFRQAGDHPDDEAFPGLLILRVEGRLYFANMPRVREQLRALVKQRQPKVIALDCSAIPDIEYTALGQLTQAEERLRDAGITLWLAALNPEALRVVESAQLGRTLGHERMFFNLEQAVTTYQRMEE